MNLWPELPGVLALAIGINTESASAADGGPAELAAVKPAISCASEAYGKDGLGAEDHAYSGSYVLLTPDRAPLAPPKLTRVPVVDDRIEGEASMAGLNTTEMEAAWRGAPAAIRELAHVVAAHRPLDPAALAEAGAEALSAGYPVPEWDSRWDGRPAPFRMTLLLQALISDNLAATRELLAAGADPDAAHGLVLFRALSTRAPETPNFVPFPDYDRGLAFLQLYLEAGADPAVRRFGFRTEAPLDCTIKMNNLGGVLMLIEQGADSWPRFPHEEGGGMSSAPMT